MKVGRRDQPAAIVGIACRFPGGADTPDAFWRVLDQGIDAIGTMPPGRFDIDRFLHAEPGTPGKIVTNEGGFLQDIDRFDASFFGISPREARKIDPQHRLMLEVCWEALEDAAIPSSSLAGKRVGVYIGIWTGEYENVMYRSPEDLDFHALTGGGRYSASGRISYALDLRGPSLTLDTGCSSGLVAVHLARQALDSGEIDLALVAGANLILQPHVNIGYSRSGMLSVGGRCRFGDASGTGYVRSEGIAALVLKPLARAQADRDPVRAAVLATAVNADGQGSGQLATPSTEAQADLLRFIYGESGIDPRSVPYIEAHGTGTNAGDPVEIGALGRVLGAGRPASEPLLLGSVKTNIGHTEACAGLAGLIKVVLALQHRRIPGNLHLKVPNPKIDWTALGVRIPTESTPWPKDAAALAGVSSFGITGTNAHAIIAGPKRVSGSQESARGEGPRIVALSARTAAALRETAEAMRDHLLDTSPALTDLAYTTTVRRDHHSHRIALIADSVSAVRDALDTYLKDGAAAGLAQGVVDTEATPRIAFVFGGQGSQWVGMGRQLMRTAPAFAASIGACEAALRPYVAWSLTAVLAGDEPGLDRIDVIQPTLAAVQIALARQLEAWGIAPTAVVGHSMGEAAAAHVAGALSLDDAMRVLAVRSRLLGEIAGRGAMALVDLEPAALQSRLAAVSGDVSIAAMNGPRSTIIAGDPAAVERLLVDLEAEGVFCRRVRVDVASHSAQCDPLLPRLRHELQGLAPTPAAVPFFSTVLARDVGDTLLGPDYWVRNLREPVRLDETVRAMITDGVDTFVEIAPHPVLLSSLQDTAAELDAPMACIPLIRREEPETARLLEAVAALHVRGVPVRWDAMAAPTSMPIALPSYRWQRERYWLETWEDWSDPNAQAGPAVTPRPAEADRHIYESVWKPVEPGPETDLSGAWLVLEDERGVGRALARRIGDAGGRVVLAPFDPQLVRPGKSAGDAARRLVERAAAGADRVRVVHLWSLDADVAGGPDMAEAALARSCGTALSLLQATGPVRIDDVWWVTRGAQGPGGRRPAADAAAQAALWGLVRTLWRERPERANRLVDLDPDVDVERAADALFASLSRFAQEPQLAFNESTPHAARMRQAPREASTTAARWRRDGAYLLTGGLGEVGLTIATEMIRGGANRFVMVGRTELPPRSDWTKLPEGEAARRTRGIRALEAMGASVHLLVVDIADELALADALERYRAEGWPPILGVVHLAAAIEDRPADRLDWSTFMAAARGKALGAWNLHRLLPDVERTVYFSSVFSVLPQPGQANYAAANAFIEHLAAARSPSTSLAWGVWKEAGLGRTWESDRQGDVMEGGLAGFDSATASALFTWTAASPQTNLVVAPVHWPAVTSALNPLYARFYEELVMIEGEGEASDPFADRLFEMPVPARARALADRIRMNVSQILEVEPTMLADNHPLGRRGLDSLGAMELRARLERELALKLPASVVWNYPTIAQLSAHLLERLERGRAEQSGDADPAPENGRANVAPSHEVIAGMAGQSEDDALHELRTGRR